MLCFSHVLVPRTSILSRPRKRALAVEIYSTSRKYGSVGPSATDSQEICTGAPIVMRSRGEPMMRVIIGTPSPSSTIAIAKVTSLAKGPNTWCATVYDEIVPLPDATPHESQPAKQCGQ